MIDYSVLKRQIKFYRKQKKITQEQLADTIGVTKNWISKIESPFSNTIPSFKIMLDISAALRVPIKYLLTDKTCFNKTEFIRQLDKLSIKELNLIYNILEAMDKE